MSWTVFLQDEAGHLIELPDLGTHIEFDLSIDNDHKASLRLLKYLDPFGDTVFNRLQMEDLIDDLRQLMTLAIVDARVIAQLIHLAARCQNDRHAYLHFYGE